LEKEAYKRTKENDIKNEIIRKIIEEWGQKNKGRFIRIYDGIAYELNQKMLKDIVQKYLVRKPNLKAQGKTTSIASPANARRPRTVSYPPASDSDTSRVKAFPSEQPTVQDYLDLLTETDMDTDDPFGEIRPSLTKEHQATFEVLFEELNGTPFLSRHEDIVQQVIASKRKVGKRKAAPRVNSKPKACKQKSTSGRVVGTRRGEPSIPK
jgi:hypothetical protein